MLHPSQSDDTRPFATHLQPVVGEFHQDDIVLGSTIPLRAVDSAFRRRHIFLSGHATHLPPLGLLHHALNAHRGIHRPAHVVPGIGAGSGDIDHGGSWPSRPDDVGIRQRRSVMRVEADAVGVAPAHGQDAKGPVGDGGGQLVALASAPEAHL